MLSAKVRPGAKETTPPRPARDRVNGAGPGRAARRRDTRDPHPFHLELFRPRTGRAARASRPPRGRWPPESGQRPHRWKILLATPISRVRVVTNRSPLCSSIDEDSVPRWIRPGVIPDPSFHEAGKLGESGSGSPAPRGQAIQPHPKERTYEPDREAAGCGDLVGSGDVSGAMPRHTVRPSGRPSHRSSRLGGTCRRGGMR